MGQLSDKNLRFLSWNHENPRIFMDHQDFLEIRQKSLIFAKKWQKKPIFEEIGKFQFVREKSILYGS